MMFKNTTSSNSRQAGGRRSLLATADVDLTNKDTIRTILNTAKNSSASTYGTAVNAVSPAAVEAAAGGVANVNALAAMADDVKVLPHLPKPWTPSVCTLILSPLRQRAYL